MAGNTKKTTKEKYPGSVGEGLQKGYAEVDNSEFVAKVDAMKRQIDSIEAKFNSQLDQLEKRIDGRFTELSKKIGSPSGSGGADLSRVQEVCNGLLNLIKAFGVSKSDEDDLREKIKNL